MKTIVRLVQTTNKSDHMIVCMDDISTCVGCRITPTGSPNLDCIDNNQSSRQTIHHLRVLLLCARAVPAVRVCTCPVHACAHYKMSDTSSEPNYSPLPLSPAPSEVLEEDPYEACSDEEDNDEEDASMKFPEMGATWEPVVHAFAGSSHQEVCDRMEDWADENGYILSRLGDKSKGQAYFYCHKVGRQKQHNRNAAQSRVVPEYSSTVPTYAPESKADCCRFNVYISRRMNGMREVWSVSPKGLRLDHNHPPQTAKQKTFLGPVNLSREDADLIMNLGQAFMPPRHVVHFNAEPRSRVHNNRSKIFMMTKGTPQRWMPMSWSTALRKREANMGGVCKRSFSSVFLLAPLLGLCSEDTK